MNFLKKKIGIIGMAIILLMAVACSKEDNMIKSDFNKDILRVQYYKQNIPENYKIINWRERAQHFDQLVFNNEATGTYLPLIWKDKKYDSFGLPAYVGDGRMHKDGAQEGVTNIASIVSATLMGLDKSKEVDYVRQLGAFFSEEEQIVLNNSEGSSETTSMWYLLYPTILFSHVSYLYEDNVELRNQMLTTIESWYQAYEIMYNNGKPDFNYTGFNFKTHEPYRNGIWTEPDSAVGIGLLMYYGYELTGEEKYLQASINSMNYLEKEYFGSPLYEALMYFGPYLAAKLNALHGTNYDITEFLNDNFNASSIPRGGWGSILGKWGDYDVNGLFGSATDGGGYAFSMNTFAAAGAIVPLVQYDSRYAKSIGKWMLHLGSNSRYYFATETNPVNQSCTYVESCNDINPLIKEAIPYEGIRKDSQGRTPWFGGDPTVYNWAKTDFSLYSGAHTGILAALLEETNVHHILRLDLQATQFYNEHDFPSFLFYNPYEELKEIEYQIHSKELVDLYNTMTNQVVKSSVTGTTTLEINKDDAIVIIEIPAGSTIVHEDKNYYVDNKFISRDLANLNILGLQNNDSVSGDFIVEIGLAANYEARIESVTVAIDKVEFHFESGEKMKFNTKDFTKGTKKIMVTVKTEDGSIDKTSIRLKFN